MTILCSDSEISTREANPKTPATELPEDWASIDTTGLDGFTETHIKQLYRTGELTPSVIQDSIDVYFFDLENNHKAKTIKCDKIAFFMSIMRRHGGIFTTPDNFESLKERTKRLWMEHKRRSSMGMEELEKEAVESAFQLWMANTSKTEKIKLIGEGGEFWVNRPSKGSVNALRLAY